MSFKDYVRIMSDEEIEEKMKILRNTLEIGLGRGRPMFTAKELDNMQQTLTICEEEMAERILLGYEDLREMNK